MARSYRGHQKLDVSRGDLVTVALQGDLGKPRPALVIQSDVFQALPSITHRSKNGGHCTSRSWGRQWLSSFQLKPGVPSDTHETTYQQKLGLFCLRP